MKTRKIHTKIWRDEWFSSLSRTSKLLFIYLITNEYIGLTGYVELSDRQMCFDTGLDSFELGLCKKELSQKVIFFNGWVYVRNLTKHDPIRGENNSLWVAYNNELSQIPKNIIHNSNEAKIDPPPTGGTPPLEGGKGIGKEKEKERKGEEKEKNIAIVFNHYIELTGSKEKLSEKRKQKIAKRIEEFGVLDCKRAIANMTRSPFHMGENDREWKANIDYIFRDFETTEKMIQMYEKRKEVTRKNGGLADFTISRVGKG